MPAGASAFIRVHLRFHLLCSPAPSARQAILCAIRDPKNPAILRRGEVFSPQAATGVTAMGAAKTGHVARTRAVLGTRVAGRSIGARVAHRGSGAAAGGIDHHRSPDRSRPREYPATRSIGHACYTPDLKASDRRGFLQDSAETNRNREKRGQKVYVISPFFSPFLKHARTFAHPTPFRARQRGLGCRRPKPAALAGRDLSDIAVCGMAAGGGVGRRTGSGRWCLLREQVVPVGPVDRWRAGRPPHYIRSPHSRKQSQFRRSLRFGRQFQFRGSRHRARQLRSRASRHSAVRRLSPSAPRGLP